MPCCGILLSCFANWALVGKQWGYQFSLSAEERCEQTKVNHLSRDQHLSAHHKCQKRTLESIWCVLRPCAVRWLLMGLRKSAAGGGWSWGVPPRAPGRRRSQQTTHTQFLGQLSRKFSANWLVRKWDLRPLLLVYNWLRRHAWKVERKEPFEWKWLTDIFSLQDAHSLPHCSVTQFHAD
jgi:hypothetical protein